MKLQQRINAFVKLGDFLNRFLTEQNQNTTLPDFEDLNQVIKTAQAYNGWFIKDNILYALQSWAGALTLKNLEKWTNNYRFPDTQPKTIAVIMAGNIPLVGFHDFISVLISGNKVLAKLSSNDKHLLPFLAKKLIDFEPDFKPFIEFTNERLNRFDAVIATGSNNSARYFEYYFGKHPHIIRKNRNSIAILTGDETQEELERLANDIFRYYGLGCRNVSKLFIPETYTFDVFFKAMFSWKHLINQAKYMNNYDYNKAVYLMSDIKLLDNEFLLLKEDAGYSSPIAVLFYETYKNTDTLAKRLSNDAHNIQCIVSSQVKTNNIPFGSTQKPQLWDYADGVDTIDFLLTIG